MNLNWSDIQSNVLAAIILAPFGVLAGFFGAWIIKAVGSRASGGKESMRFLSWLFFNMVLMCAVFLSPSKADDAQAIRKTLTVLPSVISANVIIARKSKSDSRSGSRSDSQSENTSSSSGSRVKFIPGANEIACKLSDITGLKEYYIKEFKKMSFWDGNYVVRMDYKEEDKVGATRGSLERWHPDDGATAAFTSYTDKYIKLTVYRGSFRLGSKSFNIIEEECSFAPKDVIDFLWNEIIS